MVLLQVRAEVDGAFEGKTSLTPLMAACDSGQTECVQLLMKHCANHMASLAGVERGDPSTPWEFADASELPGAEACNALIVDATREAAAEGRIGDEAALLWGVVGWSGMGIPKDTTLVRSG